MSEGIISLQFVLSLLLLHFFSFFPSLFFCLELKFMESIFQISFFLLRQISQIFLLLIVIFSKLSHFFGFHFSKSLKSLFFCLVLCNLQLLSSFKFLFFRFLEFLIGIKSKSILFLKLLRFLNTQFNCLHIWTSQVKIDLNKILESFQIVPILVSTVYRKIYDYESWGSAYSCRAVNKYFFTLLINHYI